MLKRAAPFALLLIMAAATSAAGAQSPLTKRRPTSASAAGSAVQPDGRPLVVEEEDARRTRERLSEMLRQYPPSLSEVLRIDPSLLTNEGYLAPYPALAAFLAQHPEVAHNPGYFIGEVRFREDTPTLQKMRLLQDVMIGLVMFLVFITLISVIAWLLKSLIDYRRWLRLTNVQTDVHTKL